MTARALLAPVLACLLSIGPFAVLHAAVEEGDLDPLADVGADLSGELVHARALCAFYGADAARTAWDTWTDHDAARAACDALRQSPTAAHAEAVLSELD